MKNQKCLLNIDILLKYQVICCNWFSQTSSCFHIVQSFLAVELWWIYNFLFMAGLSSSHIKFFLENNFSTLFISCIIVNSLLSYIRHAGIIASSVMREEALPLPYIFFILIFIFSLNKSLMNENDHTIEFIFCTQKINMKNTRPYLLGGRHHLPMVLIRLLISYY